MTLIYFVLQTKFYRKHFKLTSCIKISRENWWYHTCRPLIVNLLDHSRCKKTTHFKMSESEIVSLSWKSYPVHWHVPTGLNKRDCSLLIANSFKSFWSHFKTLNRKILLYTLFQTQDLENHTLCSRTFPLGPNKRAAPSDPNLPCPLLPQTGFVEQYAIWHLVYKP